MFPKFPFEMIFWVSIGDCGESTTSGGKIECPGFL
jgi:hypothetical protein